MKYLLDIILLILILPISMIVLPIISILILILDSQPVFYSQYRVGLNGKEFKLYKFRTMAESSDESIHEDHYKNLSSNAWSLIIAAEIFSGALIIFKGLSSSKTRLSALSTGGTKN